MNGGIINSVTRLHLMMHRSMNIKKINKQSCMFLPDLLLYIISELQVCVAVVRQVCASVVL